MHNMHHIRLFLLTLITAVASAGCNRGPLDVIVRYACVDDSGCADGAQCIDGTCQAAPRAAMDGKDGVDGKDGADGAPGPAGPQGVQGDVGPRGPNGFHCWDTNQNNTADPAEDRNDDGIVDVRDCGGTACWDTNGNGRGDPAEDVNGDRMVDLSDCRGPSGIHCWDLNGDGQPTYPAEDTNRDSIINVLDCRGPAGQDGMDGQDGQNGMDGRDGRNGTDGQNGQDGRDGRDGRDGTDGRDGVDGQDGRNGYNTESRNSILQPGNVCVAGGFRIEFGLDNNPANGTLDDAEVDMNRTLYLCHGVNGTDGRDGRDGVDGVDGRDGTDGRDGVDGQDGQNGQDGMDGRDGRNGTDGQNGQDGRDGRDGRDGTDGQNGYSTAVRTSTLSNSVCTAGGWLIEMGLDTNRNGTLDESEPATSSFGLCHGVPCSVETLSGGRYRMTCPGGDSVTWQNGQSCWDTNGNGEADPAEDTNFDGAVNALDCQSFPQGSCFNECGGFAPASSGPLGCWCDELCLSLGDCCADVAAYCPEIVNPPPPAPAPDAGVMSPDSGAMPPDAGSTPMDAGVPMDAGMPPGLANCGQTTGTLMMYVGTATVAVRHGFTPEASPSANETNRQFSPVNNLASNPAWTGSRVYQLPFGGFTPTQRSAWCASDWRCFNRCGYNVSLRFDGLSCICDMDGTNLPTMPLAQLPVPYPAQMPPQIP